MSGFTFRPRVKDADFYMDAIADLSEGKIKSEDRFIILDYLVTERTAAIQAGEEITATFFEYLHRYLLTQEPT